MRGTWTAVRRILVPLAWKTASNEAVKFDPRSRMRNLLRKKYLVDSACRSRV
jgi:hypothetical protein